MRRHRVLRRADRLAGGGARTAGEAQGQAYVKGGQTQRPSNEQACSARAAGATHSCLHVTPTAHHSPLPFHQLITGPGIPPLKDQD